MQTIKISATKARNEFFSLLNQVASGKQFVIKKDNEEVAILSPKQQKTDIKALIRASKAVHGIFKDLSPEEIAPVRKRGNWKRLGKWDQ